MKLHVSFWTTVDGERHKPGDEIDVDDDYGRMLIRDGKCRLAGTPEPGTPDDTAEQEPAAAQTLAATAAPAQPERPGRGADHPAWVEYAVARGMGRQEAEGKSRAQLVAHFAGS